MTKLLDRALEAAWRVTRPLRLADASAYRAGAKGSCATAP